MSVFEPISPPLLPAAYELLLHLGVTENYRGFRVAAFAAALCAQSPDFLLLTTKRLYPYLARHFDTTCVCIERNLRTVIAVAWERNPALLVDLAHYPLKYKPACTQFISILAAHLRSFGDDAVTESAPSFSNP